MDRFERAGAMTDLDAAIEAAEGAVGAVPHDHPDRGRYLSNLGIKREARFRRSGDPDDLEAAIRAGTAAVDLTPAGHPDRVMYMSNLAIAIWTGFEQDNSQADLETVIKLEQAAIDATPVGHPSRPGYLTVLGIALQATGSPASLSRAVEALEAAADATPDDDPHWAGRLSSLGDALSARFEHTEEESDRAAAISAYGKAVQQELAGPSVRIRAARAAAALTAQSDPGRAADFLEAAVRLLGEVAPRELARGDQQHQIREFTGLASDAAAFALTDDRLPAAERAARALGLLETGRAVLLSQVLDTRDDLTDLRRQHPALAKRFADLRERLDTPATASMTPESAPAARPGRVAKERRRLADQLAAALREIRAMDGFASFGLLPAIEELAAQATAGPVITVNVSTHRSDALLLTRFRDHLDPAADAHSRRAGPRDHHFPPSNSCRGRRRCRIPGPGGRPARDGRSPELAVGFSPPSRYWTLSGSASPQRPTHPGPDCGGHQVAFWGYFRSTPRAATRAILRARRVLPP